MPHFQDGRHVNTKSGILSQSFARIRNTPAMSCCIGIYIYCCSACLSSQADHPQLAACMLAQSPSSHSLRLQSEPCESSSLMAISHERRLNKHVGPDGIPYASVAAHVMFTLQEILEKIAGKVLHRPQIVETVPKS